MELRLAGDKRLTQIGKKMHLERFASDLLTSSRVQLRVIKNPGFLQYRTLLNAKERRVLGCRQITQSALESSQSWRQLAIKAGMNIAIWALIKQTLELRCNDPLANIVYARSIRCRDAV
jgi:hypothetical protein